MTDKHSTTTEAAAPAAPTLSFVMRIAAECAPPLTGGPGVLGERRHIQITGGTVQGPGIRARILPGGSDWALVRPDGTAIVTAHYTFVTDDGIPVYIQNRGLRVAPAEVIARMARGDAVPPDQYYFRTTPVFDAPMGRLQHLNDTVYTARAERLGNTTFINVFKVD